MSQRKSLDIRSFTKKDPAPGEPEQSEWPSLQDWRKSVIRNSTRSYYKDRKDLWWEKLYIRVKLLKKCPEAAAFEDDEGLDHGKLWLQNPKEMADKFDALLSNVRAAEKRKANSLGKQASSNATRVKTEHAASVKMEPMTPMTVTVKAEPSAHLSASDLEVKLPDTLDQAKVQAEYTVAQDIAKKQAEACGHNSVLTNSQDDDIGGGDRPEEMATAAEVPVLTTGQGHDIATAETVPMQETGGRDQDIATAEAVPMQETGGHDQDIATAETVPMQETGEHDQDIATPDIVPMQETCRQEQDIAAAKAVPMQEGTCDQNRAVMHDGPMDTEIPTHKQAESESEIPNAGRSPPVEATVMDSHAETGEPPIDEEKQGHNQEILTTKSAPLETNVPIGQEAAAETPSSVLMEDREEATSMQNTVRSMSTLTIFDEQAMDLFLGSLVQFVD